MKDARTHETLRHRLSKSSGSSRLLGIWISSKWKGHRGHFGFIFRRILTTDRWKLISHFIRRLDTFAENETHFRHSNYQIYFSSNSLRKIQRHHSKRDEPSVVSQFNFDYLFQTLICSSIPLKQFLHNPSNSKHDRLIKTRMHGIRW